VSSTRPEPPADADPTPADAAPAPVEPASAVEPASPEPTPAHAERAPVDEHLLIDPARVRRAPRYRGFFTVGAVVGVVVGLWLGTWLADLSIANDIPMLKPGVFVSVVALGVTTFFVLAAGALAIWADRRSLKKLR
jgi:hypothetical protein